MGPSTHVSRLVTEKGLSIQYINARDLNLALHRSTDLRHDLGDTMEEHFPVLLNRKMKDCSDWFKRNLSEKGIQEPLIIIIRTDGSWQMDNGHHRLAWAMLHDLDVPVYFDDSGADDDSVADLMVCREDVNAFHYQDCTEEIPVVEIDQPLVLRVTIVDDEVRLVPTPRVNTERKTGAGKHRAN